MPLAYNFVSLSGMGWNLFLALIPLVLASILFRARVRPGPIWWLGLAVFILFLPNAAYVLTDVVQLVRMFAGNRMCRSGRSRGLGAAIHGLHARRVRGPHDLDPAPGQLSAKLGPRAWVLPAELAINFAVAIGIYLGRFRRFNSWDVLHDPLRLGVQTAEDFSTAAPWQIVVVAFGVLVVLYYLLKFINLAVIAAIGLPSSGSNREHPRRLLGLLSTTLR